MSHPDQHPPETPEANVVPGYFSPAQAPYQPVPRQLSPNQAEQHRQAPPVQPADQLTLPLHSCTPVAAVVRFFKNFARFSGRASRSEFWMVQLFMFVVFMAVSLLTAVTGDWIISVYMMFLICAIVPGLSLTSRRLHDANLHGGLTTLVLVPFVGFLVVAVLAMLPSKDLGSRFDKYPSAAAPHGPQPR